MRDSDAKAKEKSPCSIKSVSVPEFITCTQCGADVEIWTDEDESVCSSCRRRIFRKESTVH